MRSLDSATLAALAARSLLPRLFFWITPRDFITNDAVTPVGFTNDVGAWAVSAIDGVSGSTVSRTYNGSGKTISFERVVLSSGLQIKTTNVTLNMIDVAVTNLVRGYNLRKAPAELHLGLLDPSSRLVVAPLVPVMVGWINDAPITIPPISARNSSVKLEIVGHTRSLTQVRSEKRSDASQRKRSSTDTFYEYVGPMSQIELFWGQAKGTPAPTPGQQAVNNPRRRILL